MGCSLISSWIIFFYLFVSEQFFERSREQEINRGQPLIEKCLLKVRVFLLSPFSFNAGIIQMLGSNDSVNEKEVTVTFKMTGVILTLRNHWEEKHK